jgi:TusE/DsrC/DsvC family sulfur relay protein
MASDDLDLGVPLGDENFLINPEDWTEAIAAQLAAGQNIDLSEDHWRIIWFIREWYGEHGLAPSARDAAHFIKEINAPKNFLYSLFPYGYVGQACKIAGMKKPRAWSTG